MTPAGKALDDSLGTLQEGSQVQELWNEPEYIKIYQETDITTDAFK